MFHLPKQYIGTDTGLSSQEVEDALEELVKAGRVQYDEEAEVLLDHQALQFFPPKARSRLL